MQCYSPPFRPKAPRALVRGSTRHTLCVEDVDVRLTIFKRRSVQAVVIPVLERGAVSHMFSQLVYRFSGLEGGTKLL